MVLPLLAGMLGSGLASAGILGATGFLANPLIAGSIGAGLGQFAQTGDVKEGVKTGLGSYLGGAALGTIGSKLTGGPAFNIGSYGQNELAANQLGITADQVAKPSTIPPNTMLNGRAVDGTLVNQVTGAIGNQNAGIFTPEMGSNLQNITGGKGVFGQGLGQLGSAAGIGSVYRRHGCNARLQYGRCCT